MTVNLYATKITERLIESTKNSAVLCIRYFLSGLIICIIFLVDLRAEEDSIFSVSNVHVDETSISSVDAKKKAISEGQFRAFQILLRRLIKFDELARLPEISSEEIDPYVRDFSVNNEKNSPIRYLADLTFRFKAQKIRRFLRDLEVEFAETVRKPVLILPIYDLAAAKSLWETPNPWRKAWGDLSPHVGLVPFQLPVGDLKDVGIIGAEQAATGDQPRIKAIGNQLTQAKIRTVNLLDPLPFEEPVEKIEEIEVNEEETMDSSDEIDRFKENKANKALQAAIKKKKENNDDDSQTALF